MRRKSFKWIWWASFIIYIGVTYATLGIMPAIWNKLNAILGGKGIVLQYAIYSLAGLVTLSYIVFIKKERSIVRYLLFFLFAAILCIMFKFERNPGEKIHMAQYGLAGVLLYNALKIDFDRFNIKLYLYGSLISLIAGALDEVIQGFLPNRWFTWHDVFINGASGIIILLVIRLNILSKGKS